MNQRRSPQSAQRGTKARDEAGGKRATLARALSKLGYCSRTQAEVLIAQGRVSVDRQKVTDPATWVDLDLARIAVDDAPVTAEKKLYLMLNKPRGLVTTRHDPEGRPTVYDCLKASMAHIFRRWADWTRQAKGCFSLPTTRHWRRLCSTDHPCHQDLSCPGRPDNGAGTSAANDGGHHG